MQFAANLRLCRAFFFSLRVMEFAIFRCSNSAYWKSEDCVNWICWSWNLFYYVFKKSLLIECNSTDHEFLFFQWKFQLLQQRTVFLLHQRLQSPLIFLRRNGYTTGTYNFMNCGIRISSLLCKGMFTLVWFW